MTVPVVVRAEVDLLIGWFDVRVGSLSKCGVAGAGLSIGDCAAD